VVNDENPFFFVPVALVVLLLDARAAAQTKPAPLTGSAVERTENQI